MPLTSLLRCGVALAELPPQPPDSYVGAGFAIVARAIDSDNGYASISVRLPGAPANDPLDGFRMMNLWLFGPHLAARPIIVENVMANQDLITQDPIVQRIAKEHGRHRLYHYPDPRTVPGQETSVEAGVWTEQHIVDDIKILHNVSADVEVMLGFHRQEGQSRFDDEDERMLDSLNQLLVSWARRTAFLHGFGPGMTPLAPKEREALALLLGPAAQKNFVDVLKVSAARAAEIIQGVHGKMGTSNRAELQSRWISSAQELASTPPTFARERKRGKLG